MPDIFRVGVAGLIHDHVWGMLRWWNELEGAELVAAADVNPELREKVRSEYGVPAVYASYQEMLDREKLDIVTVAVDNAGTVDVVEAAAAHGVHVLSEKPMAATLEQADRMVEACRRARVELMINWPTAWNPAIQTVDRLVRDGAVGAVHKVKYLAAHQGPKEIGCTPYFYNWLYDAQLNGAGALMDYCCYGADMAAHWIGRPASVVGIMGTLVKEDFPVDDNAIILMKYPHAFGVAEASWTQQAPDGGANPAVYGSEGTLSVVGGRIRLGRLNRDPEWMDADIPAPGRRNGAEYLVSCLRSGAPVEGMCSAQTSRTAQEILQAGLDSARQGREIPLG
ncbi:MAG TPA: Gfo/Idh/MocA family oxidoreductase [Armatimonadota bacterium]|nr:Gfo/Idh/MocA family oxidoreductase [Armatimonadota bacterium]